VAETVRDRLRALQRGVSGRSLKQWLEAGRVRVNGTVVRRGDTPVARADRIELGAPPPPPFPAPLRLVHGDEHVYVIDKPPGLLTIANAGERHHTAYRLLRDWVEAQGGRRIFVVHRLDRETSGLLVFARSPEAKEMLQKQFHHRTPERLYQARVEGVVREDEGTLTSRLAEGSSLRIRPTRDTERGREAITRYRVLERYEDSTLLELKLVTGRRGQIRAQLADLKHPIVGDREYGSRRNPFKRVCLHATRLGFMHPDGRRVTFESRAPAVFRRP
jgi:23S rRNA pseudouridine1911/1915/1917 synthase